MYILYIKYITYTFFLLDKSLCSFLPSHNVFLFLLLDQFPVCDPSLLSSAPPSWWVSSPLLAAQLWPGSGGWLRLCGWR